MRKQREQRGWSFWGLRGGLFCLAGALVISCGEQGNEDETDPYAKGDSTQLSVFFTKKQVSLARILSQETLGALTATRAGILNIDGLNLSERVVLILSGKVHRYDGQVDEHLLVVKPRFISGGEGAANPGGFLNVDFKDAASIKVVQQSGEPFGRAAGVFRGSIIATEQLTLQDAPAADLATYHLKSSRFNGSAPNLISNAEIYIQPNVAIVRLLPAGQGGDSCQGLDVVNVTQANTTLALEIQTEGFPKDKPVTVEVHYRVPHYSAGSVAEHLWDYVSGLIRDQMDDQIETQTIPMVSIDRPVQLSTYRTLEPKWGDSLFGMEIEVRAFSEQNTGAFARSYVHQLTVVREGKEVIADQFELCPKDDVACHELRDANQPDNIVARRRILEWKADQQGLMNRLTRPLSKCAGGDQVAGSYSKSCTVYRESTDSELSYKVGAELNFELMVNGKAMGSASWSTPTIPGGIASADLQAALKAAFNLDVGGHASFKKSQVWENHSSLDVIYDPSTTQIQWWRVVTPRVRYMEIASYNACGVQTNSHEIFLSDLQDSRLVLACEKVPSFDTVCHSVEPNSAAVESCNQLLILADSPQGQECLSR